MDSRAQKDEESSIDRVRLFGRCCFVAAGRASNNNY